MTTKVPDTLLVNGIRGDIPVVFALPFATEMIANYSYANIITVTLEADATLTLTGAYNKQKCILEVSQDAVGGHLLTIIGHRLGTDLTDITLSTEPNLTDKIGMIYDEATDNYDVVALMRGF